MSVMAVQGKIARSAAALMLAASLVAVAPTDASAAWRGGWRGGWHHGWRGPGVAAGIIGGLALGALAAGAYSPYYYGPGYYPAPVYDGDCYVARRRIWDGYRYRIRRVRVCD